MPFYTIEHVVPISFEKQQALAEAITEIHCRTFTVVATFCNVKFVDTSGRYTFVAGMKRPTVNIIQGNLRHGPDRTRPMYEGLCREIIAAWDRIIRDGSYKPDQNDALDDIFVTGGLILALEQGLLIPEAGHDLQWFRSTLLPELKKRQAAGNEIAKRSLERIEHIPGFEPSAAM